MVPATWPSGLGTGLQNPVHRFDSGRRLQVQSRALSSAGERFPDTEEVTGSIPVGPTPEDPPFPLGVFGRLGPSGRMRPGNATRIHGRPCQSPHRLGELNRIGRGHEGPKRSRSLDHPWAPLRRVRGLRRSGKHTSTERLTGSGSRPRIPVGNGSQRRVQPVDMPSHPPDTFRRWNSRTLTSRRCDRGTSQFRRPASVSCSRSRLW